MMNIPKDDLLYESLKVFWFAGLHPSKMSSPHALMFVLFYTSGALLIFSLAAKGVLFFSKTDIFFMAECIQTCILMLHAFGKVLNLYFHRDAILQLIELYSKFWKIKSDNGEVERDCWNLSRTIKFFVRRYFYITVVCILFFVFKPPACYIPNGWKIYVTVYHSLIFYGLALTVVATDGFFCVLGTAIITQFKLLGCEFKNMDLFLRNDKNNDIIVWNHLRKLVDYQNFLYRYCVIADHVFSGPFLIQFLASNGSAAISIFILTQRGSWNNTLKFIIYCIILVCQTMFYCIPAEFIRSAVEQLAEDLYATKWYESNSSHFKKVLNIILTRSQKLIEFSAYGLIFINLKTLIIISKTAFSFYTYLSSVKKLK